VLARVNCQDGTVLHSILTDPAIRASWLSALTNLASANGYEGLNIDFESGFPTDSAALTSFASELASDLHASGRKLSMEVSAKYYNLTTGRGGFYNYTNLALSPMDYVFVMDWGLHWGISAPGGMDDLPWATKVADYVAKQPNLAKRSREMPNRRRPARAP
jgi:spore germination protein YaaH